MKFWFRLVAPDGSVPLDGYVIAENKTKARKEVARAYRDSYPRGYLYGYWPFSKLKLEWDE